MIRDITIGQYYPKDSMIHKLDPRVKLVGTFLYIISLFLFQRFMGFIVVAAFLGWVIWMSKVPILYIMKKLRPIIVLLILTMGMNVLFSEGRVLFQWGIVRITYEGIRLAIFLSIRLIFLILGSSLMTFTTTPNHLTDGLESLLNPLKRVRFPVHELAMMMSIALRFIPILIEETDKIMKAQMARGADLENGNLIKRVKSLIPIFIPLFISAFRRANDLAMAMESRCYKGGEGRTKMKPLCYRKADGVAYMVLLGYMVVLVAVVRCIWI